MSRQIPYIRMAQDQEQRGQQGQRGRGSDTEGHSPERRLGQKGEIQARSHVDHPWPGIKAPNAEVGKDSD